MPARKIGQASLQLQEAHAQDGALPLVSTPRGIFDCFILPAATRLLQEAEGSVETAVALFFSSTGREPAPESPRSQLCTIIGPALTRDEARTLLQNAGSVTAAVDQYYAGQGMLATMHAAHKAVHTALAHVHSK